MATRKTPFYVTNDIVDCRGGIDAHYPRSKFIPRLIELFDVYEKCADKFFPDSPIKLSLRIQGHKIQIGIHADGDPCAARAAYLTFLAWAGDALDLLRGPHHGETR